MSNGSMSEVRPESVVSISSSRKSEMRSSMLSILPVCSPAVIMRMIMVGKTGCLPSAAEMLSPRSISVAAVLDGFFHDHVADGLRDNLQNFQNGHTAADERRQRAGEPRQADLMGIHSKDRQLDATVHPRIRRPAWF